MRKIHMTRQFLEASGPQGNFFEKPKKVFLDMVWRSVCTKFQICIIFLFSQMYTQNIYVYTSENKLIPYRL